MSRRLPKAETVRDLRRAQIVGAARRLVAEQGLEALTFNALESELAFTRGVITYHFRNKADIVAALFESVVSDIDATTYSAVSPSDGLEAAVRAVMSGMIRGFVQNREATAVLISYWSRVPRTPGVDSELFARYRRHSSRLVRMVGVKASPIRVESIAAIMVAVVIGAVIQLDLDERFATVDAVVDEAVATIYARLSQLASKDTA